MVARMMNTGAREEFVSVVELCREDEIALGCHFRVAAPGARVGLPEVNLGLIPGAGGTQRLPRLIGIDKALPMIVSGDPIPAKQALQYGAVESILEGELTPAAVDF